MLVCMSVAEEHDIIRATAEETQCFVAVLLPNFGKATRNYPKLAEEDDRAFDKQSGPQRCPVFACCMGPLS